MPLLVSQLSSPDPALAMEHADPHVHRVQSGMQCNSGIGCKERCDDVTGLHVNSGPHPYTCRPCAPACIQSHLQTPDACPGIATWQSVPDRAHWGQVDDGPCVTYIGDGGAGNFVKMVHNGIEYGDMQLISEAYDILKTLGGFTNEELCQTFTNWNKVGARLLSGVEAMLQHLICSKRGAMEPAVTLASGSHSCTFCIDATKLKGWLITHHTRLAWRKQWSLLPCALVKVRISPWQLWEPDTVHTLPPRTKTWLCRPSWTAS